MSTQVDNRPSQPQILIRGHGGRTVSYQEKKVMLKSTEGFDREDLSETPTDTTQPNLLSNYGIDEAQAADLRGRLRSFKEDWNRPDMDGYDAL